MKKEQTNFNLTEKLPEELKTNYKANRKSSPTIEALKVAAALKLWNDRSYRNIQFEAPIAYGGKTVFVKVLAKHADDTVVGVECASTFRLKWLQERLEVLQNCLPPHTYLIAVFPETLEKQAEKGTQFTDEVWVTGKNGVINQMMLSSYLEKE
ncbi:MAG: hypothetical protein ACQCN3_13015 [Candidatus Bathyarchaeia archaeon]